MSSEKEKKTAFLVNKINELPSLPSIVMDLTRLIDSPMASIDEIERLMSKDVGLTLKILKLANTAYYAIPGGAKTLKRAISFVGFNSIKQMVLTSTLFEMLKAENNRGFNPAVFWTHSACTGYIAELISRKFKLGAPDDAFTCGMVHDMGQVVLHMLDPETFFQTREAAAQWGVHFEIAEKDLDVPRHTHWGHVLALKWKLPLVLQSAIRDHHTARPALRITTTPEINSVVDAVWIANRITHNAELEAKRKADPTGALSGTTPAKEIPFYEFDQEVLDRCKITVPQLVEIAPEVDKASAHAKSFLQALTG